MARLMEVIEFLDNTGEQMVHRVPEAGSGEITAGSQLVVRESQSAVFFRDGKALDAFGPGRHTLTSLNIPLLVGLEGKPFAGKSPFRTEVYFVNQKVFTDRKWGTQEPIPFRDSELSMVRLRAFGLFSDRITDPRLFVNKIVGTQGLYATSDIDDFLRGIVISRFADFLGESVKTLFDLPKSYDEISAATKARVQEDFTKYGLECVDFYINAITPPEEVQKMIDERSGMGAVGDMGKFMQFEAAKAMREAAQQGGGGDGAAGTGVGLGAGLGMGMMLPGMLQKAFAEGQAIQCPKCRAAVALGSRFCPNCGANIGSTAPDTMACPKCGQPVPSNSKFCPNCGAEIKKSEDSVRCKKCNASIPPGSKFCPNCGEKA
jgi:membrane protease subunit (stomatin/prohibitin family)